MILGDEKKLSINRVILEYFNYLLKCSESINYKDKNDLINIIVDIELNLKSSEPHVLIESAQYEYMKLNYQLKLNSKGEDFDIWSFKDMIEYIKINRRDELINSIINSI